MCDLNEHRLAQDGIFEISAHLLPSVVAVESGFNPRAVSPKLAAGCRAGATRIARCDRGCARDRRTKSRLMP